MGRPAASVKALKQGRVTIHSIALSLQLWRTRGRRPEVWKAVNVAQSRPAATTKTGVSQTSRRPNTAIGALVVMRSSAYWERVALQSFGWREKSAQASKSH